MNHYEIHTQDHEEKSTADLSVKQLHKLNKELTKQRRSMDSLKRDRENILSEKTKVKNEKVLKKGGSKNDLHHRLSKKQSVEDGLGGCYTDEMKFRVKELEDQLAERDYKITALRLSIEKNSEHHSLGSDSMELESDRPAGGGGAKRTTNGGILDATAALERLLEEQDMSLKLRRENAELRSHILAMDIEWEKFHKDTDPSPRSPRKRSSGFFKRGKKSTSSMPSRRVSEETTPHDGARSLKRSPSPDIGGGKSDTQHQDVEISDILLLSRFNKESTSSLPYYGSPNQSPQMAAKNRTGSDLGTLQACLKLALSEKSLFEENNASLQKELDSAREKLNELEKSLESKMEEAVSKLQKSLEAVEIDRDTYRDELKISQQELDEMLEKQRSLGKLHLEALKAKDNRIKQLEEKLESNKKPPPSPTYGGSASSTSSKKPSAVGSTAFSLARSNSREVSTSHNAPQSITSPTQVKDVVSPTRISSTSTNTTTQGTSNAAKASDVTSPTKFSSSSSSSSSKDVTSPTRSAILQSPTKVVSEKKVASSSSSTQASDAPKQGGFVRKLSKDLSSEKLSGLPPSTSSTRKIGKLSRESSIEKFEVAKEAPQASGTKRRDSNTGIPPPSPSSSFTKVAATRAMFEQKIDQTKTSNVQIRRQLKSSGDSVEEKRRYSLGGNSAGTPENKPRTATMHSKSNSYDLSSKPPTASPKTSSTTIPEVVPDTSSSSKQDTVTPTSGERSMPNGPASVTNDDRNRTDNINRQQQEKKVNSTSVSGSSKPSSDSVFSSSSSNRVSSPTKVSKITITSTASPTNSPLPTGRKEMAAKVGQGSSLLIRNPTSPCLGGTKRTPSPTSSSMRILCGQLSSPAKVGIPTRKSSSSSFKGNDTEVSSGNSVASSSSSDSKTQANSKSQAPVRKQQSQVISSWSKTEKPSSSVSVVSSMKSSNSSSSSSSNNTTTSSSTPSASSATRPSTTVTTNSSVNISTSASNATSSTSATITTSSSTTTNSINKINGQNSSSSSTGTSNSKLTSPVAKMGSLQNIQSYLNSTNGEESKGGVVTSTAPSNTPSNSSSVSTSSSSTAVTANSGVKRGPTHRALQRRDRKDRPKTMYAGRAETTNLVNLISKFQEEEKEKKLKSTSVASQPAMAPSKPTQNGNSSMVVSNSATTINNVTMRQHAPGNIIRPRPATFYIPDSSPSR